MILEICQNKTTGFCRVTHILDKGTLHTRSQAKTRILNELFESVFSKGDDPTNIPTLEGDQYPDKPRLSIDMHVTHKVLTYLKVKKAPSPDGLPN